MRRLTILFASAACVAAVPGAADASRVELTGTAGPAAEVFPLYRAAKGERNRVHVTLSKRGVTIADRGVRRIGFARDGARICKSLSRRRVFCKESFFVDVKLGDRDDRLSFSPGQDPRAAAITDPLKLATDYSDNEGAPTSVTSVAAGRGNDVITGSAFSDFIDPGPGRDKVSGRGDGDIVAAAPDGSRDRFVGGGGVDELNYQRARHAVTVDLAAGTAGSDPDRATGIERVHGSRGRDRLMGSPDGDALYGEGGNDFVDGRAGNDLVVGDSPLGGRGVNTLIGGDGDDVVDARGSAFAPTSTVICGAGADRVVSDTDDSLDAACESTVFRVPSDFLPDEQPLYDVQMAIKPLAQDATSLTFDVPCPNGTQYPGMGSACNGMVAAEKPPADVNGSTGTYGSAPFAIAPGGHQVVKVTLDADGQNSLAHFLPIAIHVTGEIPPAPAPGRTPPKIDFGWQAIFQP